MYQIPPSAASLGTATKNGYTCSGYSRASITSTDMQCSDDMDMCDRSKISYHYEKIALRNQGRPHWGKCNYQTSKFYKPLFPKFEDFVRIRQELDPNRIFVNDYISEVLEAH